MTQQSMPIHMAADNRRLALKALTYDWWATLRQVTLTKFMCMLIELLFLEV